MRDADKRVVIIGAGPAGLTAAYELGKAGVRAVVLEKDDVVGGLSRTLRHKGFHFDIGGHRFFTKVGAVDDLWREVLPNGDFLRRRRLSRIYYDKKFFHYPLRLGPTLSNLGLRNSALILASYLRARLFPLRREETFEQWVTNRFGRRFFRLFFKTYTEKVWGIPCDEITAEWAAQRIKDLSLFTAIKNVFVKPRAGDSGSVIKTLVEEFDYPSRGPGMMWERMAALVERGGGEILTGARVERLVCRGGRVEAVEVERAGERLRVEGTHFVSSMPARELVGKLYPAAPAPVREAARALNYRDFIVVMLVVGRAEVFPDNWLYIHEPEVRLGRVQNYKNWSPEMVPDASKTCLGLEYFCFEGDGLWAMPDAELIELGKRELERLGLVCAAEVEDGTVVRVEKAYPVYDSTYRESLALMRDHLRGIDNLQLVGRNGMHRYNNQDHSMLTAMLAVENILGADFDLWQVNAEGEYHEEVRRSAGPAAGELFGRLASTQPHVPTRVRAARPPVIPVEQFDEP